MPTTNDDLWFGTSTLSGGTNVVSTGTAAPKSAMGAHGMTFNNNFNTTNSITVGTFTTGSFPITFASTNPLVGPFIQTLTTSGTIRFQDAEPVAGNANIMTIVLNINTNLTFDLASGSTVDIACKLTQPNAGFSGGITKISAGSLTLENSNSFAGGVALKAGTLNVSHGQALGLPSGTFTVTGGSLDNTSGSALTLSNYLNAWNGDFTFKGTSDLNLGAGAVTLNATRQITVTGGNLTVGGVVGPSSGGFGLTKAGNGTLILNGANTYNGNTTISAGKLTLGASASISNSTNISVNGTLDVSAVSGFNLGASQNLLGSGSVTGNVATVSGSKIIPGTDGATGTLTLTSGLTLASGATCNYDLGSTAAGPNDLLNVNGTGTALTLNNNTFVIKAASTLDVATDYTLISVPNGSITGTFNSTPTWSGTPPANSSSYSIVTSAHSVTLHYTPVVTGVDHYTVTPSTSSTTAGNVLTVTVVAYNASNVAITDSSVDGTIVSMTSSGLGQFDSNGDATYGDNTKALTNGTLTINVRDLKAESITFTATSGSISNISSSVSFTVGALTQLQLLLPGETATPGVAPGKTGSPTTRTAGAGFSVTVNAVDANYNLTASGHTVHIAAANDANAVLPADTALSSGTATLSVTNIIAGSGRTLTASDVSNGSITSSTSPAYNVIPATATRLVLRAPGETATYGVAPGKTGSPTARNSTVGYSVTVDALDAFYNLATNTTDTVGITSGTGGDTLPANVALVGGTKNFSVANNTVGSTTLTASDVSNGGVTSGSSTVTVNINSTTTAIASSSNPVNEGQNVTFTATVSGAGLKTGTVTFKNGATTIATKSLSGSTATLTLSGGAGTYSITAVYNGDANNSTSTSSALSQVIQVGGAVAGPAQLLEEGQDYAVVGTTGNPPTGRGPWLIAGGSGNTSFINIQTNDLSGATSPDLKPLPNTLNTGGSKLQVAKATAAGRWYWRGMSNSVTAGVVYYSFLLNTTVNPTTSDEFMATMLASTANNQPAATDPLSLHARVGADSAHYNLGIQRLNGTTAWSGDLADNTTYLIVLKYTFGSGASCSLYVNPTPGGSEPSPTASATSDGVTTEPANIGTVLVYESSTAPATSGTFQYDVMRADTNWNNVTPSINGSAGLGATKLAFSPGSQTLTVTSNSALITVTLLDQSNSVYNATSDLTVNLSSTSGGATFLAADGSTVISSLVITSGLSTATFYYRDSQAGSPTITGASGLLTSATQTETINPPPGALDHFVVTPSVPSITAGGLFTANVQAYDSNNVAIVDASLDGQIVTLSSSGLAQFDANGDGTYGDNTKSLVNGALTINVRDLKAENVTLTATLGTPAGNSSSVTINPAAVAQLQLLLPGETATPGLSPGKTGSPTTRTSGIGFSITVNSVDTNWNVAASSDTVQITATSDASAVLPANTALVAGTKTLSVTNAVAGSLRSLTATDISNGAITASTSPTYTVVAGAATRLIVMAPGESATYGVAPGKSGTPSHQTQTGSFTLTVNALDAFYNFVSSATDTVQITSTDGGATLPTNAQLVSGAKSFTLTQSLIGSVTDTATDLSNGGVASGTTTLTVDAIPRYRSIASGNWGDTSTWEYSTDGGATWNPAGGTPSNAAAALVLVTNSTVTIASDVAINRTTVAANGSISVSAGVKFSVTDATAIDLDVFGTITNAGVLTNISPATIVMENGAKYYHNQNGGSLLVANWNSNSTCEVIGWTTTTSVNAATGMKQKFGNFNWNSPSQSATLSFGSSTPTNFAGSFNVISTGSGVLELSISAAVNLEIGGDVNVSGGTLNGITTSATELVNVAGSLNISGGTFNLHSSATGTGSSIWNVAGNVNVNGGTLTASSTTGSTSPTINLVKSGTQTISLSNGGSIPTGSTIAWNVASTSKVNLGTNVINGVGGFTLNSGGGLITAKSNGFKGNLNLPGTNISLSLGGNYTYDGSVAQSVDTLLPASVSNLTVNNNLGLTLTQSTAVTNLSLIGSTLTGNVTVANAGSATISGGGSTVVGNLTMNAGVLALVSSNNFPQLTASGGTVSLNGGNITLTIQGAPLGEGAYLVVDTASGGTVSGTLPSVVNISGTDMPSTSFGVPQLVGGKLYVNYQKFFSAYDTGAGFFSGENLVHDDFSGRTFSVWSTADLSLPVSSWTAEGSPVEFPISGSSPAMSHYGITVTPSASPTYYVIATTNAGPYSATEPVIVLTTADYVDFTVVPTNAYVSAGGIFSFEAPPVITVQPASVSKLKGQTAQFNVTSTGAGLSYQWYYNGGGLGGATSAGLTLANVTSANAGNYTVTVANGSGVVTSSVAGLTVSLPPEVTATFTNGGLVLGGISVTGLVYVVEGATNLSAPVWTPVWTNTTGAGGLINYQPASSAAASQFYRIAFP